MKRPSEDVAGRPRAAAAIPDVAGRRAISANDAATYRQDLQDPMSTAAADAALLEDFMEFLSDDHEIELGSARAPDPVFRERLRSRLWRNFVLAYLRKGHETH